jgi:hypothetical protein
MSESPVNLARVAAGCGLTNGQESKAGIALLHKSVISTVDRLDGSAMIKSGSAQSTTGVRNNFLVRSIAWEGSGRFRKARLGFLSRASKFSYLIVS